MEKNELKEFIIKEICNDITDFKSIRDKIDFYLSLDNENDLYLRAAMAITGRTRDQIMSNSRKKEDVAGRSFIFYALRKFSGYKYREIGEMYGRHHAAVINCIKNVENMDITKNEYYKDLYDRFSFFLGKKLV